MARTPELLKDSVFLCALFVCEHALRTKNADQHIAGDGRRVSGFEDQVCYATGNGGHRNRFRVFAPGGQQRWEIVGNVTRGKQRYGDPWDSRQEGRRWLTGSHIVHVSAVGCLRCEHVLG